MIFNKDDLPAPLRPMRQIRSPCVIETFTASNKGSRPNANETFSKLMRILITNVQLTKAYNIFAKVMLMPHQSLLFFLFTDGFHPFFIITGTRNCLGIEN